MIDAVKEFWAIIMALVAFAVWLVRLEGRVNANSKELMRLEKQIDTDRSDARANRAEQNDMLREMQRDIKLLLGRGHQVHWNDKTAPPR